jgi:hypothetical protein
MFACAVVCLAGAIGTATAVFAIVNAVVLRPLPFQHANRLVAIWGINPARDTVKRGFSWPDTIDLSRSTRSLDGVAALANAPSGMTLTGRGDPAQIPMWVVSGNFFDVLGVPAAFGRTLSVEHDVVPMSRTIDQLCRLVNTLILEVVVMDCRPCPRHVAGSVRSPAKP